MGSLTAAYRSWSGPARAMAVAVDAAVTAAQAGDTVVFTDTLADLGRVDREQLAVLLGDVTRDLLERAHPDGLDSDDAEEVVQACLRSAASWYEALDTDSVVRALTDALGVSDPDEAPQVDGAALLTHGVQLIASLLTTLDEPLAPVLDLALRELLRAQTIELP